MLSWKWEWAGSWWKIKEKLVVQTVLYKISFARPSGQQQFFSLQISSIFRNIKSTVCTVLFQTPAQFKWLSRKVIPLALPVSHPDTLVHKQLERQLPCPVSGSQVWRQFTLKDTWEIRLPCAFWFVCEWLH